MLSFHATVGERDIPIQTPHRDIKAFQSPLTPAVMASFFSLFLLRETAEKFRLPIKEL